ncbi:MAG: hypothetical protein AAGH99_11015 [Planctomycetota bacterium]
MNETNPPTDPKLDALLDEALAPSDLPAGLNDRIFAETADRLPGVYEEQPVVIAKIGGGYPWRSIAAVLLFALVLGGVWVANQGEKMVHPSDLNAAAAEQIENALDQLAEAELEAEWIDDRIDILSLQITSAEGSAVWGDGSLESLDSAIARETFDDVADEMEWYF